MPKKKQEKLNDGPYQGIYIGYEGTNQYRVYNLQSSQVSVPKDMYFDKAYRYNRKYLKPGEFADDAQHIEDDKLFADLTDILDASKSVSEFNTIPCKSNKTYPYPNKSCGLSPLTDILDLVGDKKHYEEDNAFSENIQLRKETKKESNLQFNKRDRDSDIQTSDVTSKKSHQKYLAKPTPGTQQSACIKDKTPASTNVMRSIFASLSVPKSHIHMVTVLANFNAGCNDFGLEEPFFLKEAMLSLYWKDFKKVMHAELQSLIENNTWEYRDMLLGRAILTGCYIFQIKKDR